MNRITNHQELQLEILRLETLNEQQAELLSIQFSELMTEMKPSNLAGNMMSGLFSKENENTPALLLKITNYLLIFIAEKIFLKKSPGFIKAILAYVVGNMTSKVMARKTNILQKIRSFLPSRKEKTDTNFN